MRRLLATVALILPALVAAIVAFPRPTPQAEEFQRLVGGLGLGPAVDFSFCAGEFDPRVESRCSFRFEPVPCGSLFCPAHPD